jgi:nucleoside recognition membrane protein YjiH
MSNFFALPGFRKYFANTSWLLEKCLGIMAVCMCIKTYHLIVKEAFKYKIAGVRIDSVI